MAGLAAIRDEIAADPVLHRRIVEKYRIKNTTGYSLNAFVDHHDPLDILLHLMVGSEGTLAFLSEVTYRTVPEQLAQGERAGALRGRRGRGPGHHAAQGRAGRRRSS